MNEDAHDAIINTYSAIYLPHLSPCFSAHPHHSSVVDDHLPRGSPRGQGAGGRQGAGAGSGGRQDRGQAKAAGTGSAGTGPERRHRPGGGRPRNDHLLGSNQPSHAHDLSFAFYLYSDMGREAVCNCIPAVSWPRRFCLIPTSASSNAFALYMGQYGRQLHICVSELFKC